MYSYLMKKKSLLFLFENDSPSWTQLPGHRNTDPVNGKLNLEMKIIVNVRLVTIVHILRAITFTCMVHRL